MSETSCMVGFRSKGRLDATDACLSGACWPPLRGQPGPATLTFHTECGYRIGLMVSGWNFALKELKQELEEAQW